MVSIFGRYDDNTPAPQKMTETIELHFVVEAPPSSDHALLRELVRDASVAFGDGLGVGALLFPYELRAFVLGRVRAIYDLVLLHRAAPSNVMPEVFPGPGSRLVFERGLVKVDVIEALPADLFNLSLYLPEAEDDPEGGPPPVFLAPDGDAPEGMPVTFLAPDGVLPEGMPDGFLGGKS